MLARAGRTRPLVTFTLLVMAAACAPHRSPPSCPSGEPDGRAPSSAPKLLLAHAAYVGVACAPGDVAPGGQGACVAARVRPAVPGEGQGGVQRAYLFEVQAPFTVWRLWASRAQPASRLGRWWSAERPAGDPDAYRRAFAVCKAWNGFQHLVRCTVKRGTIVAAGLTASVAAASCQSAQESYPASETWQLFISYPQAELDSCEDWNLGSTLDEARSCHPVADPPGCQ